MGDLETNWLQAHRARRIEQMVAKWLHRSQDGASRGRASATDTAGDDSSQPASRVQLTVAVRKDVVLHHYGFEICPALPLTIASVTAGSTAEGKLQPGDQLLLINSTAVDDVSVEQAAGIIREAGDELLLTVLRGTSGGPKSSFLTAEKRAKLKTNPVKVRFAEEVLVNAHAQGSSLLCMPNVLKVYLENGQTKAFRFEASTTVKDILLTLKEKLSLRSIAHFALALEEQHNAAKIHLLHEDEFIEQVVQKRESHDCRCLFRVCFIPKDPLDLLQDDPVTFEYLYLQSCSDVLQEKFAVEMKCSVALRLAALYMQERIHTCAQPQKVSLKRIERDWGIENFISPTLLRNMRGKDIKKAISYHMKRNQVLLDPRRKHMLATVQVRLSYLQILGDLKMYNGRIFNATLMLQDRESHVALLVGAKYGVSQIVNSKLNIITSLAEFASISRVELVEESEKVSTVKIYLQDLKLLTLLLEANSAKDLVCLIAGYYRLLVDATVSIFTWAGKEQRLHRVSAEEGYESRTCSDSEDSWELDSSLERCLDSPTANSSIQLACSKEKLGELHSLEKDSTKTQAGGSHLCSAGDNTTDSISASEASDSANTESREFKTSGSSDSMDALEEDELEACSSSRPEFFHFYAPTVQEMSCSDKSFIDIHDAGGSSKAETRDYFCFLRVPHTEEPGCEGSPSEQRGEDAGGSVMETKLPERDTMGYYSLCYSTSPVGMESNTSGSPQRRPWEERSAQEGALLTAEPAAEVSDLVLEPSLSTDDSSSEEEFYDAADRLSLLDALAGYSTTSLEGTDRSCVLKKPKRSRSRESLTPGQTAREKHRKEKELVCARSLRKRRSFLKTDYTVQVSFPTASPDPLQGSWLPRIPALAPPPLPSSENIEKDGDLEGPAATQPQGDAAGTAASARDPTETERDTVEAKSVTGSAVSSGSAVHLQGGQHWETGTDSAVHVGSSLRATRAAPLPCLHRGEEPRSRSSVQSRAAQGRSPPSTSTGWLREESCVGTEDGPDRAALEEQGEVDTAQQSAGKLPLVLGHKVTCLADEHPQSPSAACEAAQKQRVDAACEEPVPGPCEGRTACGDTCAGDSSGGDLLLAKSRHTLAEAAVLQVHSRSCVGFPDASQLLAGCNCTSGVITRVSWLSSGARTGFAPPSPPREMAGAPREPLSPRKSSGCLQEDAAQSETPTSPAGPPCKEEPVDSQGKGDGERRRAAHRQMWPLQTLLLSEQADELGKDPPLPSSPALSASLRSLGKDLGDQGVPNPSFLCFNCRQDEQIPPDPITTRSLGFSSVTKVSPPQFGTDKCSCQLSYISCFHRPGDKGEHKATKTTCSTFLEPLTTPPPSSNGSLPGSPASGSPTCPPGDEAGQPPPVQALRHLQDKAQRSATDFSSFLACTAELRELVGKLSGNQAMHSQGQCVERSAESKDALGSASRYLLSGCQELLRTEQPLKLLQEVLRSTFDRLVQLAASCFQVTRCQLCGQRQPELRAALVDVVGTYHQLVRAVQQQLHRQGCLDLSARLLTRQHTALTAATLGLLQQFQAPP
ncbi:FRPD1 protein, partial [Rhinopomastus cyanomelas]|nr:FRPD1 protein [Rhinopomastus cyanomelas]